MAGGTTFEVVPVVTSKETREVVAPHLTSYRKATCSDAE